MNFVGVLSLICLGLFQILSPVSGKGQYVQPLNSGLQFTIPYVRVQFCLYFFLPRHKYA